MQECKHKRKIIVVLPASLINNFYLELISGCTGEDYITNKERVSLYEYQNDNNIIEYNKLYQKIEDRIHKYYYIVFSII